MLDDGNAQLESPVSTFGKVLARLEPILKQ